MSFEKALELARLGYGRKKIMKLAQVGENAARRAIDRVKQLAESKTADDLLDLLRRNQEGLELSALEQFEAGSTSELERRGHTFRLQHGRLCLVREPASAVQDNAIAGIFDPTRRVHRFAVFTDTHFGGYQAQPAFVLAVLEEAGRRSCAAAFHVGDHVDGPPSMHRGFEYELGLTKADDQVDFAVSVYRQSPVPIIGITGNHDGSFFKAAGLDVGRMIAERCEQFTHLGPIAGWIEGPNGADDFIRLYHPGDGCSYALSYKDQKTAEFLALSNDKAPSGFHFTGHYHKQNAMRGPNGARYFLTPASCATTEFMRAKRLINQAGAYFIEFTLDKQGRVDRCTVEDVVLAPDQWTRCDYSGFKRRAIKLQTKPMAW